MLFKLRNILLKMDYYSSKKGAAKILSFFMMKGDL